MKLENKLLAFNSLVFFGGVIWYLQNLPKEEAEKLLAITTIVILVGIIVFAYFVAQTNKLAGK